MSKCLGVDEGDEGEEDEDEWTVSQTIGCKREEDVSADFTCTACLFSSLLSSHLKQRNRQLLTEALAFIRCDVALIGTN